MKQRERERSCLREPQMSDAEFELLVGGSGGGGITGGWSEDGTGEQETPVRPPVTTGVLEGRYNGIV